MPPAAFQTVNDLMYRQYAKIIAEPAKMSKRQWPFVMDRFKKHQSGEIAWDPIRESVKEREDTRRYICCEKETDLTLAQPRVCPPTCKCGRSELMGVVLFKEVTSAHHVHIPISR